MIAMVVSAAIGVGILVVIPLVAIYLIATKVTGVRRWLGGAAIVAYVIASWGGVAYVVGGVQRGDSSGPTYKRGSPPTNYPPPPR